MNASAAAELHERTKHTWQRIRAEPRGLDWGNHPLPFKLYPDLEPLALPRELPDSGMPATKVLSDHVMPPARALDLAGLARLLFFSAGVTRILHRVLFRAAPSAGALYPTELYTVCGPLADLPAGVYHFEPAEFALRRLRAGDFRARLAASAAAPAIAGLPLCLVLTGIPWRTTWKYGQRGYRHLFWDAGAIVANLLALAAAAGWGARVLLGFVDEEVSGLVGIGEPEEYPLALVTVQAPAVAAATDSPPLGPISPRTRPLSRSPRAYPLVSAAQRAGELPSAAAVTAWRNQAGRVRAQPATRPLAASEVGQAGAATDTIETVILRRGSTRRFARHPLPRGALRWAMAAATRPVPGDFVSPPVTLLEHFLAVHAVEGLTPGAYRWSEGEFQLLRAGAERGRTRSLCLGQDLGGDAAATVFHSAWLEPVLEALGSRGYRAAQLEAGVAAERLQLAAFALGVGATGLTFLDDDVSAFFGTRAAPMLTVAVGVPAYRARPGMRPAQLPRIGVAER
ncbi:MAG TPA: SagB family peptide dehydrogenase [Actinomycetes bacterium]|nr:SagB family peptide dehydrogenase [Actinomycetes bacterium]